MVNWIASNIGELRKIAVKSPQVRTFPCACAAESRTIFSYHQCINAALPHFAAHRQSEAIGQKRPEHHPELFGARGTLRLRVDIEFVAVEPVRPPGDLRPMEFAKPRR